MVKDSGTPEEKFNLITARLVFPFFPPGTSIAKMVEYNITNKLAPGGTVVMEFFGKKHPWGPQQDCHTHTEEEIKGFFPESKYKQTNLTNFFKSVPLAEGGTQCNWDETTVVAVKR